VLGLYVSRLLKLSMVLLTGLPFLSIVQFLGGIEPGLLLASYVFLGLAMASLAAMSIFHSLLARKPLQAIVRTYLIAAGYVIVSTLSGILLLPPVGLATWPSTDTWISPVQVEDVVLWLNAGNPLAVAFRIIEGIERGRTLDAILPGLLQSYAWFHGLLAII